MESTAAVREFFPSIEQFRHVVRAERDRAAYDNRQPGKRFYTGTVKLHGTLGGISMTKAGEIIYRGRNRALSIEDDNYGFVAHLTANELAVRQILADLHDHYAADMITIFGEWCGQGIQKGVGISAEPKLFMVFAVAADDKWVDASIVGRSPAARIFNIYDYSHWRIEIDFNSPEQSQNHLIELTEAVERSCPVAKAFGHNGIGEGIVWTPTDADRDSRF